MFYRVREKVMVIFWQQIFNHNNPFQLKIGYSCNTATSFFFYDGNNRDSTLRKCVTLPFVSFSNNLYYILEKKVVKDGITRCGRQKFIQSLYR